MGKLALVGDGIRTSDDHGVTWQTQTSPVASPLNDVAWGVDKFVAVGDNASSVSAIVTSPDGVTWTNRSISAPGNLNAVHHNGTKWLATGGFGNVYDSTDGVSWTLIFDGQSYGSQNNFGLTWLPVSSLWVTVSSGGKILTSPDGASWYERATFAEGFQDIIFDGENLIAVGYDGLIVHSTNAIDWTRATLTPTTLDRFISVTSHSQGRRVAVGESGRYAYSEPGTPGSWTTAKQGTDYIEAVKWSGTHYVAIVNNNSNGPSLRSTDGANWSAGGNTGLTRIGDLAVKPDAAAPVMGWAIGLRMK